MKLFNPTYFPNFLDHIDLSAEQIKQNIIEFKLEFSKLKDEQAEWLIQFPTFNTLFTSGFMSTNLYQIKANFMNSIWQKIIVFSTSIDFLMKFYNV